MAPSGTRSDDGNTMVRPPFPKSLTAFRVWFPDDAACYHYLVRCRWPDGYECPRCDGRTGWRVVRTVKSRSRRADPPSPFERVLYECAACGHQTSLTAGTILDATKLPLTTWFWAAFFAATDKRGLSATLLARYLDIGSYKTAWFLLHKLRRSMVNASRTRLSGTVEVDGTYVGGYQPGLKGGRQRKAAMVLVAAEAQAEVKGRARAGRIRMEVVRAENAEALADLFVRTIEPGSTIVSDNLGSYTAAAASGYTLRAKTQGDLNAAGATQVVANVHRSIANLKGWLNGTHHGVGRPHLQTYLDEFVFRFYRRGNPEAAFRTLLGLGSGHEPVCRRTITNAHDLPYFYEGDEKGAADAA
jgi:hypothetical protein